MSTVSSSGCFLPRIGDKNLVAKDRCNTSHDSAGNLLRALPPDGRIEASISRVVEISKRISVDSIGTS